MSLPPKKGIFIGLAIAIIAAALLYLLRGGLEKNMVYFVTPTELMAKGKAAVGSPVRLGGVVSAGTIHFDSGILTFDLKDESKTISVVTTKTPPQMFHDGIGVVVEGSLRPNGKFEAERLMVKHGNEYRPPQKGEMPQEIYRELQKQK